MRKWIASFLAAIASLAGAATAQAAAIPVSTLLADFSLITNGNFTTSNEVVGPVLIGGNLRDTGIINTKPVVPLPIPVAGLGEVNVFGNVVGTTVSGSPIVGSKSVVLIGGTNPTSPSTVTATFPNKNTTLSVLSGNPFTGINFATDIWGPLTGASANLATLTTANGSFNPTTGAFTCTGCTGNYVWDITTAQLEAAITPLIFPNCLREPSPTCAGVVNVDGTSFSSTRTFFPLTALEGLIFNFYDGTTITINGAFEASILAPDANLQSSSFIEGNVVTDSVGAAGAIGGEIHYFPFDCSDDLCVCPPGTPGCGSGPGPMPEPGSLAVLGTALAGSFAVIRRRRA
jgi:choice-of-anchor A domain-containing protein